MSAAATTAMRQAHGEFAAAIAALAFRDDRPVLHLDEPAHERQPDAEAAVRARERAIDLRKRIEDRREVLRRNPHARIAHAKRDEIVFARRGQRDPPAARRVFRRVVDQVRQDLRDPREIAAHVHRFRRHLDRQRVAVAVDVRLARLDRGGHHLLHVDGADLELDLAAGDPRHVEQVVDEPHELLQLAGDQVARPHHLAGIVAADAHDVHGVADRRQRIAQLVREHREELVLPLVLVLDLAKQQRVVDRRRRTRRELGHHRERIGVEVSRRRFQSQRQHAQRATAHDERCEQQRVRREAPRQRDLRRLWPVRITLDRLGLAGASARARSHRAAAHRRSRGSNR